MVRKTVEINSSCGPLDRRSSIACCVGLIHSFVQINSDSYTMNYMGVGKGISRRLQAASNKPSRPPVQESQLVQLIKGGKTQREIAKQLGYSQTTIKYWLKKFGLKTNNRKGRKKKHTGTGKYTSSQCDKHGKTRFVLAKSSGKYQCLKCRSAAVDRRRIKNKKTLVEEHGGKCIQCGYNKTISALHFHHRDPKNKLFVISSAWGKSLDSLRKEAEKCDLLCDVCHAEEHEIPVSSKMTTAAVQQRAYRKRKNKLVELHGGACLLCGYNKSVNSLHFHHLDSEKKKFTIGGNAMSYKWTKLWAESCKCALLCGNCHIETENGIYSKDELEEKQKAFICLIPLIPKLEKPKKLIILCLDCGISVSGKRAKRCTKHAGIAREKIEWPSYEELIKELSSSSFSALGRKLGVSDNAIRKRLKSHPTADINK